MRLTVLFHNRDKMVFTLTAPDDWRTAEWLYGQVHSGAVGSAEVPFRSATVSLVYDSIDNVVIEMTS